jgi:hypothetical protein
MQPEERVGLSYKNRRFNNCLTGPKSRLYVMAS